MALHPPACFECGGESHSITIRTKPVVFECYDCSQVFTRRNPRGVPVASLRRIRRQIVQHWDQVADDVYHLFQEIRNAPLGTFTDEEAERAAFELDQTVWDVMVNYRPRLPGGDRANGARRAPAPFGRGPCLAHFGGGRPDAHLPNATRRRQPLDETVL